MSGSLGLPQFTSLDVEGFPSHLTSILQNNLAKIDDLLKENHLYTWDNLMYPLDDLADRIEREWSPISHLHSVMDSPALRECYDKCLPLLSSYEAAIGHNHALYEAIKSIDLNPLNEVQNKIIADSLLDFKLSGVALTSKDKKRFETIQARLSLLSNQFSNNVLDAAQAFNLTITDAEQLRGLPEHALNTARDLARENNQTGYQLTLEYPCFQAVITHVQNRDLRQKMYHAYVTRASDEGPHAGVYDNSALIEEILALRHEKALLLGFKNYAELSLATKMAESPEHVLEFLYNLVQRTRDQAKEEFLQLEQFAKEQYHLSSVEPWDIAFLSEQRQKALHDISQEELRPYFPQPQVFKGLFTIIKNLYGMTLEEINGVDIWHKDVQCFALIDARNEVRGYVYTDLYARPNKRSGAWMDSLQSRRKLIDGAIQLPIATLTCNFAKSSGEKPACLSHDEVITLFHEMGHCLHHLLTQVDYLSTSGINGVEWDAVELPSQFFENWCWDQAALDLLTAHIETSEPISQTLYEKLVAAKNFQSAMSLVRQMEFSLFDFHIHHDYQAKDSFITDILADIRSKTNVLPIAPYNRFQHSFNHIFNGGYAAGYYSYSWAEVLSSDAFSRFEEEGIFNPQTGQDFLKCILEIGGSKRAADAYQEFRGQPATVDALLRHHGIK